MIYQYELKFGLDVIALCELDLNGESKTIEQIEQYDLVITMIEQTIQQIVLYDDLVCQVMQVQ